MRQADQNEKVNFVRYRAGNIGDLIKHSWLIEILSFLKKKKAKSPFHYADTFSGFDEYGIGEGQAERIRKHLSRSPLFKIQKRALSRDRYLGSVSIARKVLGSAARLEVFDRNPNALDCFRGSGIGTLKIKSGYDVLKQKKPYDLIFLDPYDDFLDGYEVVLEKICRRAKGSSVLLFFPFKHAAHEKGVLRTIGQSGSRYIHGSIDRGDPLLDGIYRFAVLLFPASHMDGKAYRHLTRKLAATTAMIQGLRAPG
jgi:23S rRNA A2030 N6-methylase RlmJ